MRILLIFRETSGAYLNTSSFHQKFPNLNFNKTISYSGHSRHVFGSCPDNVKLFMISLSGCPKRFRVIKTGYFFI